MQSAEPDLESEFGDDEESDSYSTSFSYGGMLYQNCCMYAGNASNNDPECEGYDCYDRIEKLGKAAEFILLFLFFFGLILSVIGNISVMTVLTCGRRKRRRSFNIFLLNLALADWTLGIVCIPFIFANIIMGEWIFGLGMCKVVPFVNKVSQIVSIFTLTAIGMDRYCAVMYPLRPRMDNGKKKGVVAGIWFLAVGISSPKLFVLTTRAYIVDFGTRNAYTCSERWSGRHSGDIYDWTLFCLSFVLPLLLLSFCYGRVAKKLWTRNLPGNADPERDHEQNKNKRKTVRMLISVVVLFAICWLPMHIYNFIRTFHPAIFQDSPTKTRLFRASVYVWLTLTDTIVNPIVYVFVSDRFRKDLKLMFMRWTRRCFPERTEGFTEYRSQYTTSMIETSPYTTRRTRLSPLADRQGAQHCNSSHGTNPAGNGNYLTVNTYNDSFKNRGEVRIDKTIAEEEEGDGASKL